MPISLLVIAAHPDDETLGAGALLARLTRTGHDCRVAHLTRGAPATHPDADSYARTRALEAGRALGVAGIPDGKIQPLGFEDQKTSDCLIACIDALEQLIRELQPRWVLTHPYEGGHPDHDSAAFCTRMALDRISGPIRFGEFTAYFSESGTQGSPLRNQEFLPAPNGPRARVIPLSEAERRLKESMFDCYESQAEVLKYFRPPQRELFRSAPRYDFTQAPHRGVLFYEQFDWGMTGERWRSRVREAFAELRSPA